MSNKRPTQCQMIIQYMEEEGSITTLDAFRELGVVRLGSRISELRADGMEIQDEWTHRLNRWGHPVKFKKYFRPKKEQQDLFQ